MASTAMIDSGIRRRRALIAWIRENGGYCHANVDVAYDNVQSFHLSVKSGESISSGSTILRCPMTCILTVLNALDSPPFSSHGTSFPRRFLETQSSHVIQYFFLMEQRILGPRSWWANYIVTLPDLRVSPDYVPFEQEDMPWIEGTNLRFALVSQLRKWKEQYSRGLDSLEALRWPNAVDGKYTWELFVWAVKQFDSRSFTPKLLSDTLPAEKSTSMGRQLPDHDDLARIFEEGFSLLIPLMDLTSHKPLSPIEWTHNMRDIGMVSLSELIGGTEVCNNYGPKDNETLLLAYGFTMTDNPFDIVMISLKAPPGSPLEAARTIWRRRNIDYEAVGSLYIMNLDHPDASPASNRQTAIFSTALLASISVLVANDREIRSNVFQEHQTLVDPAMEQSPFDRQRNVVATCAQLAVECRSRLGVILTHAQRIDNSISPANAVQVHANVYRDSQCSTLRNAWLLCSFELDRARSDVLSPSRELSTMISQHKVSAENKAKLANFLVSKETSLVLENILFTASYVTSFLDDATEEGLKQAIQEIKTRRSRPKAYENSDDSQLLLSCHVPSQVLSKFIFTVFLASLRFRLADKHYRGRSYTSDRFANWVVMLGDQYPFHSAELNLPTGELLPWLESLLNVFPDGDWSQELLCWAWNVVEEETVVCPVRNGQEATAVETELLLYVPAFKGASE